MTAAVPRVIAHTASDAPCKGGPMSPRYWQPTRKAAQPMFFRKKPKTPKRSYELERCFNAAYEAAQVHKTENPSIVHAVLRHEDKFLIYAWCEVDDQVYDYTLNKNPIPRQYYYEGNSVVETGIKRYTFAEFQAMLLKISGFGPFEKSFFRTVINDLQGRGPTNQSSGEI